MNHKKGALVLFLIFCLSVAGFADTILSSDITRLGVGARPLGMGKTFAALADDVSAVFLNPSGLSQIKSDQIMSMSGKFINQVNYFTVATAIPSNNGTLGFGYSNSSFGFSSPALNLVEISPGEYRVVPSTTETVSSNDNSYVVSLAYGNTFFRDNLSLGGTVKFFNEAISGNTTGNSFGFDLDLGALYKPNKVLSLGINAKNVLPSGLGGKVKWDTGLEESLPTTINAGGNVKLTDLGNTRLGELNLGADFEFSPNTSNMPGFWHLGIEWWPIEFMGLRTGVDQDIIGSGTGSGFSVTNNPSAGLSLLFSNFRFDYAYHTYNDISANATSYFSLSYLMPKPKPKPVKKEMLVITQPKDQTIEYNMIIGINGKVFDNRIISLTLNDRAISFDKNGNFKSISDLKMGRNSFTVQGFDASKEVIASAQARVARLKSFPDVPNEYWARPPIEYLATLGIIGGYPDNTFRPDRQLTRAELSTLLVNAASLEPKVPNTNLFTDVPPSHWAASYINVAFRNKYIYGYPDGTFMPSKALTRAEGVSIIARFAGVVSNKVIEAPYADVPGRHWAAAAIKGAKDAGLLTDYVKVVQFFPDQTLTRAEAAYMLSRTGFGKAKIDDLTFKN